VIPIIWRVNVFDDIDSTNTWLVARAMDEEPEGLVALARHQSAGRGRLDRRWEAPKDASLLTSVLLRRELRIEDAQLATAAVALATRSALVRQSGVRPKLKWPNDLVVGDKKIGGFLAEASRSPKKGSYIVVGVGLNLTWPGPPEANGTCVKDEVGVTLDPRGLLDLVLEELETRCDQLNSPEGRSQLRDEYRGALATMGRRVRIEQFERSFEAVATDVTDEGHLIVVSSDGDEMTLVTGDVVHLRTIDEDVS